MATFAKMSQGRREEIEPQGTQGQCNKHTFDFCIAFRVPFVTPFLLFYNEAMASISTSTSSGKRAT